jgi:hypothetical protein
MVATEKGVFRVSLAPIASSPLATWKPASTTPNLILQRSGTGPVGAFAGQTALVSRDEGLSWRTCGPLSPTAFLYGLTFNYQNTSVALAATSEGLFRSVDSCANWEKVTADLRSETVGAVLFHPTRTDLAFAAQGGRIFRSGDGGYRWGGYRWEPIEEQEHSNWWPSALLVLPGAPERLFALFPRRGIFSDLIAAPENRTKTIARTQ